MENLRIYQTSKTLISKVYLLIANEKSLRNDFSLNDQLKRAAISVILNIAEGNARGSKQFKNYLKISCGSCNEVIAALEIVAVVYQIKTDALADEYKILARQITAFSRSF